MVNGASGRSAQILYIIVEIGTARPAFDHQPKTDFQYRHKWHDHDVVMWDNRCLLHRAGGGYDIRLLHKTAVAGDKPH